MWKKIIATFAILIFTSTVGVLGYIFYLQYKGPASAIITKPAPLVGNFFPVAENKTPVITATTSNNTGTSTGNPDTTPVVTDNQINSDVLLSNVASIFSLKNSSSSDVFFISKSKGNLYQINQSKNKRLTNTTITGIKKAFIGKNKGNRYLFLQMLKNGQIDNELGFFSQATSTNLFSENEINLQSLSNSIYSFTTNPTQDSVFYLKIENNLAVGYLDTPDLGTPKAILSTPFSDWDASWPEKETVTLQTKPSATVPGYLHFFNTKSLVSNKILGNISGLTTLTSPDAKKILYSKTNLGKLELYLYDVTKESADKLSIATLPEKCVWINTNYAYCAVPRTIPIGNFPDLWYQGQIGFNDDIWLVDALNKNVKLVAPIKGEYDLVELNTTPNGDTLYGINKKDNSLQSFLLPVVI